jgi:hypothetical protein
MHTACVPPEFAARMPVSSEIHGLCATRSGRSHLAMLRHLHGFPQAVAALPFVLRTFMHHIFQGPSGRVGLATWIVHALMHSRSRGVQPRPMPPFLRKVRTWSAVAIVYSAPRVLAAFFCTGGGVQFQIVGGETVPRDCVLLMCHPCICLRS